MARIIALDCGNKRTGIAVTDPSQIIASPHETIPTHTLVDYLQTYCKQEQVETIVIGWPKDLMGRETDGTAEAIRVFNTLKKRFKDQDIVKHDERFTSKMALDSMIASGSKKKDRLKKAGNIDKISAAIILQSYMDSKH